MENRLTVEYNRGKSRVVEMVYQSPLKIFEMRSPGNSDAVRVILSNHGGGMLQGDDVGLRICGKSDTYTEMESQANTHIYRNENGKTSVFTVEGYLESGSSFFLNTEPVVLHKEAQYRQRINWSMDPGARLICADWFQSGRSENGEAFLFSSYETQFSVKINEKPFLLEKFRCIPDSDIPSGPAGFLHFDHMITVYCIGDCFSDLPVFKNSELKRIVPFYNKPAEILSGPVITVHSLRDNMGFVIRGLAKKRSDLEIVVNIIGDLAESLK